MDLSAYSRRQLQEFCQDHDLYAGGSHAELEARINDAITVDRAVMVFFPARSEWREGFIGRVLRQAKFQVCYLDDGKSCVHSLMEDAFELIKEESEVEESEEEGDDLDLPATMGWTQGMRLEVCWRIEQGRNKHTLHHMSMQWWPATLGRRAKGATDTDGRQLYYLIYDALPELGFDEAERVKVGFIDGEALYDRDRGEMTWRLIEASRTDEGSSSTEGSEYEDDGYDIDDLTAGMAGLGSGALGGARPPRKRALIVACSYPGSGAPLPGTLNDATDIHSLLVNEFDFPNTVENLMILRDDDDDMMLQPTRRNILKGFHWLLSDLQSGDSLFLYFSGHGGNEDDPTGREWRGNQTICPCDHQRAGVIKDSEIYEVLVKPLPRNTTLHALIDSCHSGTVMNLPYNAVLDGGRFSDWEEEYPGESWKRGTAGGLAVQFSAARHDQYATEAPMGRGKRGSRGKRASQSRGAATYAFTKAIQHHRGRWGSDILYSDLLEKMSAELKDSEFCDQDPQMSCTQQLDLDRPDVKVTI